MRSGGEWRRVGSSRRARFCRVAVQAALGAAVACAAWGQGSVADGDATFTYVTFGTNPCSADRASFVPGTVGGAPDVAWSIWWWLGVDGLAEAALPAPSAQSYVGDRATLDFDALGGVAGLTARLVGTVRDGAGDNQATWFEELTLTNASGAAVEIDVIHYADIEAGGTFATDDAENPDLADPSWIRITDPAAPDFFEDYRAAQPDAFQVNAYPGLCALLGDGSASDLADTGLPFGPGDFTGAFEWRGRILPDGGSITLVTAVGIDEPTLPGLVFQDDFESQDFTRWTSAQPPP